MEEQEALDTLRGLRGLRDALMGFDHVISKIEPLVEMVGNAKKTVADASNSLASIEAEANEKRKEIVSLNSQIDKLRGRLSKITEAVELAHKA